MIKTFALGADSHVEIDIKKNDDGKMILTVSVDENTSDKQELSEVKSLEYYLGKTVEFGLMDKTYKWKKHITQPQIALWVDMCSNLVGLENKWVWAESMWGLKYLKQVRSRTINEQGFVVGEKKIFACFE